MASTSAADPSSSAADPSSSAADPSSSAADTSSTMKETRNWVEMPAEIMGGMILQRLGAVEILISAQKVCTTWRRICKDPAMWKVIRINYSFHASDKDYAIKKLIKQAVHRSGGELIDIGLKWFGTDDLLDFISRSSSKLNRLSLTNCSKITGRGLNNALKKLPHLETLHLSYIDICAQDIEVIGRNCPQLNSFTLKTKFMECDGDVRSIANSSAQADSAISLAVENGVKVLDLNLGFAEKYYKLPVSFASKSIKVLRLKGLKFDLSDLIPACPLLGSLSLTSCEFVKDVDFSSDGDVGTIIS